MHLRSADAHPEATHTTGDEVQALPIALPSARLADEARVGSLQPWRNELRAERTPRLFVGGECEHYVTCQRPCGCADCEHAEGHRRDGGLHVARSEPVQVAVANVRREGV